MSIRSIDMMILYSKTAEIEKMHQAQQQSPTVSHQQLTEEAQKKKELERAQVAKMAKGDGGKVERKKEHEGGQGGQGGQPGEDEEQQEGKKSKTLTPGSIDIRI